MPHTARARGAMLWLAALAAGCAPANLDAEARKLLCPVGLPGQALLAAVGDTDELLRSGKIDLHRRVPADDGVEIDVWAIRARFLEAGLEAPRGTVVLLHPLMTSKAWFLPVAQRLARRGWDAVLIDLRAHGASGGRYVTWEAKEKHDVRAVVDAMVDEEDLSPRVLAFGSSMGGMVAVQYAAIDPRCRGVLVFAPPAGGRQTARRILSGLSPEDFEEALRRAEAMGEFRFDDASTVAAAARFRGPLVLVHGALDLIVPFEQGQAIRQAAAGPGELIRLPLDGHAAEIARDDWIVEQIDRLDGMASQPAEQAGSGP